MIENPWIKRIEIGTALTVFGLAISAFALSFFAIADLAASFGVKPAWLAYLFPVLIDGAVIVASLSILRSEMNKERDWMGWGLLGLGTLASFVFNVGHSGVEISLNPMILLHLTMSAVPPVFLAWSFHMLTKQVGQTAEKGHILTSINDLTERFNELKRELSDLETERGRLVQQNDKLTKNRTEIMNEIETLKAEIADLTNEKDQLVKSIDRIGNIDTNDAYQMLLNYVSHNPNASYSDIADVIGKAKSTVYQYVTQMKKDGLLKKNGHGWEVLS